MQYPLVHIEKLQKSFGNRCVLDIPSLDIHEGHIIGLLGLNGAGKSTLLRHLIGMYLPDRGVCKTLGTESSRLKSEELSRIGYVHQEGSLIEWMSVDQTLGYISGFYPKWNRDLEDRLVRSFGIDRNAVVGKLSPGERQKVAIILAVAFEPELLLMDEPASALDPIARKDFLELLLDLIQNEGRTIIISSHILSDVEKVVDQTIVMERGRILEYSELDELRERYRKIRVSSLSALRAFAPLASTRILQVEGDQALVSVPSDILAQLEASDSRSIVVSTPEPLTLEELFLGAVQKN